MKSNDHFQPRTKPDKTELLANVRWHSSQRVSKADPIRDFDLIGSAEEIGQEIGRRLALRHFNGVRFKGKIEITWRNAPSEEST